MHRQRMLHFFITLGLLVGMLLAPRLAAGSPGSSVAPTIPGKVWQSILAQMPPGEGPILHAENTSDGDLFGAEVAISGDTVVVSTHYKSVGDEINAGAVYVFQRDWGGLDHWGLVTSLYAEEPQDNANFGSSVSISGDTVVVGANGIDLDDGLGNFLFDAGLAYVFERDQGGPNQWGLADTLRASDAEASDTFGDSVAIDGDILVVGATGEDGASTNPGANRGAVYVFDRNPTDPNAWDETATLHASDAEDGDLFGNAVAISGNTLAVGAYAEDTTGFYAGAVYVYERDMVNASTWYEVILHAGDAEEEDHYGISVAISGDTLVVGASQEDTSGEDAGAAYVYERNQGGLNSWGETDILYAKDADESDLFGYSVAINDDNLVVGASYAGGPNSSLGVRAGAIYMFERNENAPNTWDDTAVLRASEIQEDDAFGGAVGISGDTLIVGAPLEDGGAGDAIESAGAAYIFGPPLDLGISKTASSTSATPGDTVTFTLNFSNVGEATARSVRVTNFTPVAFKVTGITSDIAITNIGSDLLYTWEVADLAANAQGTINITTELTRCLPAGMVISGLATITNTTSLKDISLFNNSSTADVTIINAAPAAANDIYSIAQATSLSVNAPQGVLANDDDANCDSLATTLFTAPTHGSVNLAADGSFVYTPSPDFSGMDSFIYTASDGDESDTAAVIINVTPGDGYPLFLPLVIRGIP